LIEVTKDWCSRQLLAMKFAKKRPVIGFDINQARVSELKSDQDRTLEARALNSWLPQSIWLNSTDKIIIK